MKKKKAPLFPLLGLMLFPLILLGGGLFFCFHSSGFSAAKIGSTFAFNDNWEIEPLTEKQRTELLTEVFPKTYYYIGSETHCYVFISEDRNHILKLFKTKSLSPKIGWIRYLLFGLHNLSSSYPFDNQFLSEHIFANYKNAYESLRCESGLIYIHLNRTKEFRTQVHLVDSKGKHHRINIDNFEFILQKKGCPLLKHLENIIQSHKQDVLRAAIRSFLQLVAIRCEKGFACQDVSLADRYGFVGSQPMLFDCGILSKDPSMKYPLSIQREVLKATERLNMWAYENHPEIACIIQEEAQQIINQIF